MCKKYNGWANYPTWNVYTWLTNAEHTYNFWLDQAREATQHTHPGLTLADALKESIEMEGYDALGNGLYADILGWALAVVDYRAIADAFLDEIIDEVSTNA